MTLTITLITIETFINDEFMKYFCTFVLSLEISFKWHLTWLSTLMFAMSRWDSWDTGIKYTLTNWSLGFRHKVVYFSSGQIYKVSCVSDSMFSSPDPSQTRAPLSSWCRRRLVPRGWRPWLVETDHVTWILASDWLPGPVIPGIQQRGVMLSLIPANISHVNVVITTQIWAT